MTEEEKNMAKGICFLWIILTLLWTSLGTKDVKAKGGSIPGFALIKNDRTQEKRYIPIEVQILNKTANGGEVMYIARIPAVVLDECGIEPERDGVVVPLAYCEYGDEDPSYSITLSIKMNYLKQTAYGYNHAAVKDYQARWVQLDPAVTVTALDMRAICWGENWINENQAGDCTPMRYYPASGYRRFQNPPPGTWKVLDPNWDNLWVILNGGYSHTGKVTANLKRGSTTWTFEICIAIGGQEVYGCPNCGP